MGRQVDKKSFVERIKKMTNSEYIPISDYVSSSEKVLMYHTKCKNHYEVTPNNFLKGRRCPYCAGKKLTNRNNIVTVSPELLKEWDYEKNFPLTPDKIFASSNKKVYWKCKNNHSWLASPNSRKTGIGCPHCYKDKNLKNSASNEQNIKKILNNYNLKAIADYRIPECRTVRPIPFSLAIFYNEKLIGLIDYHGKYYSKISKNIKEKYCIANKINYFKIELVNNQITENDLKELNKWLKNIIGGNEDAI